MNVIFSLFLMTVAWGDLKDRQVSLALCLAAGTMGVVSSLGTGIGRMLLSVIPGVLLLVISKVSGGAVGTGDGWFFMAAGLCLGVEKVLLLFFYGVMCCGLFSFGVMAAGMLQRRNLKNKAVPFLPFLVPPWLILWLGGVWSG